MKGPRIKQTPVGDLLAGPIAYGSLFTPAQRVQYWCVYGEYSWNCGPWDN